jgi:hypothetical protein
MWFFCRFLTLPCVLPRVSYGKLEYYDIYPVHLPVYTAAMVSIAIEFVDAIRNSIPIFSLLFLLKKKPSLRDGLSMSQCLHRFEISNQFTDFYQYLLEHYFIRGNSNVIYIITYLRSWALLEKLPIAQPLKNFPAFYGTRRFITVFTRALHWSLSWANSIQSTPSHPISLRSI